MIDTTPFTESLDTGASPEAVGADPALDTACADGDFDGAAVAAVAAATGGGGAPGPRPAPARSSDASRG